MQKLEDNDKIGDVGQVHSFSEGTSDGRFWTQEWMSLMRESQSYYSTWTIPVLKKKFAVWSDFNQLILTSPSLCFHLGQSS